MAGVGVVAIFVLSTFIGWSGACGLNDVVIYKVTLRTLWSEESFPKDYPDNRPKAQWSPVFGQSHNESYYLYRVGELASEKLRTFAQYGRPGDLVIDDFQTSELGEGLVNGDEPRVYDQFLSSPIGHGVGETENVLFVDGAHSLVSVVCRLVPSPDWFVGVDSLDLCVDSSWVDQVKLDLEPLDAGAASGLTFTAPRWETSPPAPVSRHTPRLPAHPAAGFYYPHLRELPPIANVEFTKVKEYSNREMNDLLRKELIAQLKLKDKRKGIPKKLKKNMLEKPLDLPKDSKKTVDNNQRNISTIRTTTEPEFQADLKSLDAVVLAVANGQKLGLGKKLPRHFRARLHHAVNKIKPDDCLVSEWSDWSACSVTCGFGDKYRFRRVLRESKRDGRACPALTQRDHCGDVNSCADVDYFEW